MWNAYWFTLVQAFPVQEAHVTGQQFVGSPASVIVILVGVLEAKAFHSGSVAVGTKILYVDAFLTSLQILN